MLRHVHWESTMFGGADDVGETEKDLCWMLEALVQRNVDYLRQRPNTPRLYKSGVVWEAPKQFDGECEEVHILKKALGSSANQRDVKRVLDLVQAVFGGEHFCDIGVILELGKIDCDGLAGWRCAEWRRAGVEAKPMMTKRTRWDGGVTYHALVRVPPINEAGRVGNKAPDHLWTSEDPSLLLGMGGASRAADRAEEIRKNKERCEYLKRRGGAALSDDAIDDVLGLRSRASTGSDPLRAEIARMLAGRAA